MAARLRRNTHAIGWTSYNTPSSLKSGSETATFLYGPDRQYVRQILSTSTSSETTHYIGGLLEKMVKGTVTDYRHYVQVNGQTVAVVSRKSSGTNAVRYMLEDNQGSAAVLVNSSGGSIVRESFGAFGLSRNGATWSGAVPSASRTSINGISRRGYTGHSMLGNMGLTHMNGRVQDAVTGRFLSPDPYVQDPGFTQSYNRYAYVVNNPLSYIDPSGFWWVDDETCLNTLEAARRMFNGAAAVGIPADFNVVDVENNARELKEVVGNGCRPIYQPDTPSPFSPATQPDDGGFYSPGPSPGTRTPAKETTTNIGQGMPQSQSLLDWLKNSSCKTGNWFAQGSQNLGKASGAIVMGGLAVSASSVMFGPEALAPGGAMIATGGILGVGAGGSQFIAGALQYLGGADNHNMRNSAVSAGGGFVINRALFGLGRPVGGRAAQMQLDRASTQVGGAYDAITGFLDDMAPSVVPCGGN